MFLNQLEGSDAAIARGKHLLRKQLKANFSNKDTITGIRTKAY